MTTVDCSDPQAVFNRLATLHNETAKRNAAIESLQLQQDDSDSEYDQLERLALVYLSQLDFPTVLAKATIGDYSWESVDYVIFPDGASITASPVQSANKIEHLTLEEVTAVLEEPGTTEAALEAAVEDSLDEIWLTPPNLKLSEGA